MSWRMAVAVWLSRRLVRRQLARTDSPERAAARFERSALFSRPPRFLRHLERHYAKTELHWIGCGRHDPDRLIYYIHGGAFISGSPRTHAALMGRIAKLTGVEVVAPRYHLLQERPFPAAVLDVRAGWEVLMRLGYRPENIVIGGDSAGGGLAAGLLAALLAEGQAPAGLFAFSPWTDLTLSGETLQSNGPVDALLPVERIDEVRDRYLAGADPADPRASPLLADYADPPPVMIQVGADEALLSDSLQFAERLRAAGGEVRCDVWPGVLHVWQMADGWLPEARQALLQVADFIQDSFTKARR